MKSVLAVAILFIATLSLALCGTSASRVESAEIEVRAAEAARITALLHADIPAFEKLMADEVTYVHASGKVDTKSSYLEAIRSGQLRYHSWHLKQMNVHVIGETAVLNGSYEISASDLRVQPDPISVTVFFLTVYTRRDGGWRQLAWQTTKAPVAIQ